MDSIRVEDDKFASIFPLLASTFLPFHHLPFLFLPLGLHIAYTPEHLLFYRSGCPPELCMLQLPCSITFAFCCTDQCFQSFVDVMGIDRLWNKCFLFITTGNYLNSIIVINCIYSVIIFSYFLLS